MRFSQLVCPRNNLGVNFHEMHNVKCHRASVVVRLTKDRVRALGRVVRWKHSRQSPHQHFVTAAHLERKMVTTQSCFTLKDFKSTRKRQSCHQLPTGTSDHSHGKITSRLMKPIGIPCVWLASGPWPRGGIRGSCTAKIL